MLTVDMTQQYMVSDFITKCTI